MSDLARIDASTLVARRNIPLTNPEGRRRPGGDRWGSPPVNMSAVPRFNLSTLAISAYHMEGRDACLIGAHPWS